MIPVTYLVTFMNSLPQDLFRIFNVLPISRDRVTKDYPGHASLTTTHVRDSSYPPPNCEVHPPTPPSFFGPSYGGRRKKD